MTSRMIPAGTTLMFLAILYFILIAVQGIRRKLRLKQLICLPVSICLPERLGLRFASTSIICSPITIP